MESTSGKIADKIAARQAAKNKAKLAAKKPAAPVKKKRSKKLASSIKGAKATKLKKVAAKKKAVLDKKANPKSLVAAKKKVSAALKKLGLKSAGFGRYHKGKGTPITHWVIRGPKSGLPILVDRKQRARLLGKAAPVAKKPTVKAKPAAVKKPAAPVKKVSARKAHEAKKAELTKMHIARLDKKRAEMLAAKGKPADKPMTKRERLKREASVRKLHRVLDKNFKREVLARRKQKVADKVKAKVATKAQKIIKKHVIGK